jgi:hypothetical protein
MTEINEKPKKRDDLAIKELGDEIMLYDETNEKIHVLNHTAYLIWGFCDGLHTLKDIEEEMNNKFSMINSSAMLKDIMNAIDDFKNNKLIINQ